MTVEEIRELIKLATETGIAELEVQRGQDRVRIRRAGTNQEVTIGSPAIAANAPAPVALGAAAGAVPAALFETARDRTEPPADPNLILVKSPIVGTFYEGPSPDAAPFVRVGERVQPGHVLCIIESMKLMNEIESELAGVVESQLVRNGQPVEYGEALFAIRAV
jgi:acetyl-CoA carboxylase biotin carboxyl carrier protein